ncbi:MAG: type II toxin-antitoxin system VapC family toxin [Terracidiphilus sp.]
MKIYVLDASAAIVFLSKSTNYERVVALVKKVSQGEARLIISAINWGEVIYSIAKNIGLYRATSDLKAMSAFLEPVAVDEALAEAAATVKFHYKLGYADCFAAALAMRMDATLVTTDPDFAKLGKKLKILSLSSKT